MKYLDIRLFDVANGPGVRTTLFVTGCIHACPGCFNLIAQDATVGHDFTEETIEYILETLEPSHMTGLTLLGGEPMDPRNQKDVHDLIMAVKEKFGDKRSVWMWTGYIYPGDFNPDNRGARAVTDYSKGILENLEVLVDGPFVQDLKSAKLQFRGSANQHIIDMPKSLETGRKVVIQADKDEDLVMEIYTGAAERRKHKKEEKEREQELNN